MVAVIHLNNGYTGSVKILSQILIEAQKNGKPFKLISSFNKSGFLDQIEDKFKISVEYRATGIWFIKAWSFFKFQIKSIFLLYKLKEYKLWYINTTEPLMVGLFGKMIGKTIIFHLHESPNNQRFFSKLNLWAMGWSSHKIICVSDYVFNSLKPANQAKAFVIKNALKLNLSKFPKSLDIQRPKVLMVSSPKRYKGIFEFCQLAERLPKFDFLLICSGEKSAISKLFKPYLKSQNLRILSQQANIQSYYDDSHLILNLTHDDSVIESFGLSILEAMHQGLPSIVPEKGGICELVEENVNGFRISVKDLMGIQSKILEIFHDHDNYQELSKQCLLKAMTFDFKFFKNSIYLHLWPEN